MASSRQMMRDDVPRQARLTGTGREIDQDRYFQQHLIIGIRETADETKTALEFGFKVSDIQQWTKQAKYVMIGTTSYIFMGQSSMNFQKY